MEIMSSSEARRKAEEVRKNISNIELRICNDAIVEAITSGKNQATIYKPISTETKGTLEENGYKVKDSSCNDPRDHYVATEISW